MTAAIPPTTGLVPPANEDMSDVNGATNIVKDSEKTFLEHGQTPELSSGHASIVDEKAPPPPEVQASPRDIHGLKWGLAVVAVLSSTFLFALDNTIVADIQPAIIKQFGSITKLAWLSSSFLLAAASTNLVWGKIYGQFDAKILYIINVVIFEVGSAVCGAAPTINALIVGRAICGLGGSGMYCGVMTLLSVTTTERERPTYIGLTGLTWGAGTVLGPIIGGAFTDSGATWRWAFYINLVIGGIFAPVYLFILPRFDPRPGVPIMKRLREVDWVGTLLIIGAFTSGVMAISFGGNLYAWNSGRVIGLFCTSGVLFIMFGTQQGLALLTTKERRIFPVEFLRQRIMLILFASTSAAATATFLPIYFIPLYFIFVKNDSALDAGVRLLPFVFLLVFFCIANGGILSAYGLYMPWYLVGGLFVVAGGAAMYTIDSNTSTGAIYGYSILLGIGAGMYVQTSFSVAQAKTEPHMIPLAIGFITCGQIAGATIALSISNAVFLNESTANISQILPDVTRSQIQATISGAGSSFINGLDSDTKARVTAAIVQAIDKVYILEIAAGCITVVLSLGMKMEKLFLEGGGAA